LQQVSFAGRLATHRYMDMPHVISEALDFSQAYIQAINTTEAPPIFPDMEG
jgi:UDP-galactopyranose mutase